MTYPTISEMDEMEAAPPTIKAALEFIWAFTDWWEKLEAEELPGDPGALFEMEGAYERWRNLR